MMQLNDFILRFLWGTADDRLQVFKTKPVGFLMYCAGRRVALLRVFLSSLSSFAAICWVIRAFITMSAMRRGYSAFLFVVPSSLLPSSTSSHLLCLQEEFVAPPSLLCLRIPARAVLECVFPKDFRLTKE